MRIGIGLLIGAFVVAGATFIEQARATGFANYSAFVLVSGVVSKGSGIAAATRTSTGTYEITFVRPVDGCTHLVTLRGVTPGMVAVAPKVPTTTVLVVSVFSRTGVKENRPFNMLVQCNS